jgi:Raf kinase inhibitor-like YbhB/YbcL family protein
MKKNILVSSLMGFASVALVGGYVFYFNSQKSDAALKSMIKISSPVFSEGSTIPIKYTCDGSNASPELNVSDVPDSAKSLVLIVDDPDAPGGTFSHWIVWNIDAKINSMSENKLPSGAIAGINDAGKNRYTGPCPPSGTHRYTFTIYALDITLNIPANSKRADLEKAMQGHIVDQGELVGKYARQ